MEHIGDLLDLARESRPEREVSPTGFDRLDDVVGGFAPGRLWVLTATPGQGTSTLLTQWAGELAVGTGWQVRLYVPRDEQAKVTERLLASMAGVPLNGQQQTMREREQAWQRLRTAEESLRASRLYVGSWASGSSLFSSDDLSGQALLLDDVDMFTPAVRPESLRAASDAGAFVMVVVPRHLLVAGPHVDDDLDPGWSRAADLILELRSEGAWQWAAAWSRDPVWSGWAADRRSLGESLLRVLKNRHGPLFEVTLRNEVWRARFAAQRDAPSIPTL